jgi:hypothetical protein
MTLFACFLVATGLLVPTQSTIWWMNICYAIPTLSLFYFARAIPSHWDCLFLIYGLCFFMLPKISPLNFIFGIVGAAVLSVIFIYISSFRLSLQQWLLSTCILLMMTTLFGYMCYCSEKLSREKWLLHARLKREKINFRIVSSLSIQDDFNRTVSEENPFHVNVNTVLPLPASTVSTISPTAANSNSSNPLSYLADAVVGIANSGRRRLSGSYGSTDSTSSSPNKDTGSNDSSDDDTNIIIDSNTLYEAYMQSNNSSSTSSSGNDSLADSTVSAADEERMNKEKRMTKFYRGIFAWAICYSMAYAFDVEEVNKSPAFALLMHTMGFSIFLVVLTQQIRWLALNGIVGLTMLWAFNQAGIRAEWVVFSTHSVGYIILFAVVVIMILVFGGVVFVWSHLLDFLKDILVKYPQVKTELSEDKILENLIVGFLAELPNTKSALLVHSKHVVHAEDEERGRDAVSKSSPSAASVGGAVTASVAHIAGKPAGITSSSNNKHNKKSAGNALSVNLNGVPSVANPEQYCKPILSARRPNVCYFCYSPSPQLLIPACEGWQNNNAGTGANTSASSGNAGGGIKMCTPYTEAVNKKETALRKIDELHAQVERMKIDFDARAAKITVEWKDTLAAEKRAHDAAIQSIITQHNQQLGEVKRLYRAYKTQCEARGNDKRYHPVDGERDSTGINGSQLKQEQLPVPIKFIASSIASAGVSSPRARQQPSLTASSATSKTENRRPSAEGTMCAATLSASGNSGRSSTAKRSNSLTVVPTGAVPVVQKAAYEGSCTKAEIVSASIPSNEISTTPAKELSQDSSYEAIVNYDKTHAAESTNNHLQVTSVWQQSSVSPSSSSAAVPFSSPFAVSDSNDPTYGNHNMPFEQHLLCALESLLSGMDDDGFDC